MTNSTEYKIIKKINAGSKADVFFAIQNQGSGFAKMRAIKKLLTNGPVGSDSELDLRKEAEIGCLLQHVNVVEVTDFLKIDGTYALAMEFVNGVNALELFQISKRINMDISVSMAAYIGAEIARALDYIHLQNDPLTGKSLDIIHCDVSPENILISYEGEVKLGDFGMARYRNDCSNSEILLIKDKFRYMSPEFLHSRRADPRLDIYSLGVVLWELLSGKELFKADTVEKISNLKVNQLSNLRLSAFNERVDEELEEIINKCLSYDPVKRFRTGREVEIELTRYFHKRDPEFIPQKLGRFLTGLRSKEYKQTQKMIRNSFPKVDFYTKYVQDNLLQQDTNTSASIASEAEEQIQGNLALSPPSYGKNQKPEKFEATRKTKRLGGAARKRKHYLAEEYNEGTGMLSAILKLLAVSFLAAAGLILVLYLTNHPLIGKLSAKLGFEPKAKSSWRPPE